MKVIIQLGHYSNSVLQTPTKNIEMVLAEDSIEGMDRINMLTKEKQKVMFILVRAKMD